MSDDEWDELNHRVALSGHQKQDYLIQSCLHQRLVVIGNRAQFRKLEPVLTRIAEQLERLTSATGLDPGLLAPIRTAVEIIRGFKPYAEAEEASH
jgi:hypothetical protein